MDTGSISVTGNSTISHTGLEDILTLLNASNLALNYSEASETITVSDIGLTQISSDATTSSVSLGMPGNSLLINAGDMGDDVINIVSLENGVNPFVTIDGQGGVDTLSIDGSVDAVQLIAYADVIKVNASVST